MPRRPTSYHFEFELSGYTLYFSKLQPCRSVVLCSSANFIFYTEESRGDTMTFWIINHIKVNLNVETKVNM